MGYYLSEKDREALLPIYPKLKDTREDLVLPHKYPKRLAYLIRNAFNIIPEWIVFKDKFKLITREDRVILRIKSLQIEFDIEWKELVSPDYIEFADLLIKKESAIRVYSPTFSDEELNKIKQFCTQNDYTYSDFDDGFTVKKSLHHE